MRKNELPRTCVRGIRRLLPSASTYLSALSADIRPRISRNNYKLFLIIFAAAFFIFSANLALAQLQPVSVSEMDDKSETTILENGDAKVKEVISMSTSAYVSFKQRYPVLSMFTRIFKPANMPTQIENLNLSLDEGKNQIIADYTMKGAAVNQGDHWEIEATSAETGEKIDLVSQNNNVLVFSMVGSSDAEIRMITTVTLKLPKQAKNINFDKEASKVTYKMSSTILGEKMIFLVLGAVFMLLGIMSYVFLGRNEAVSQNPSVIAR